MKDFMWYFWRAFKSMLKVWVGIGLGFCVVALIAYVCWVLINCVGPIFAGVIVLVFVSLFCAIGNAIFDYKMDKERWR